MNGGSDTIAALATAPGRGAVGIVRVSGLETRRVAERLLGHCPVPRRAELLPFRDPAGELIDQGIALFFPAPHSFTGEDVIEFQGHGGPALLDLLLSALFQLGVRPARPGEFSERAFLNGKLDLTQAEAIADLIESSTAGAARLALRSLQGAFSERIHALVAALTELRSYVEAAIDFSDEEVDFLSEGQVGGRLSALRRQLEAVLEAGRQGSLLREGMTVVIAGLPNAGKSSLLNALAGRERAIVTAIPGTTRDVLREPIAIDGIPLHLIDTAGLRESDDPVEQEGIRRAWSEIGQADRLLLIVDDRSGATEAERAILRRLPAPLPVTLVRNKIDLSGAPPGAGEGEFGTEVRLSALTGEGLQRLRDHLKASLGYTGGEGLFMARRRHLEALGRAAACLDRAIGLLAMAHQPELLAEELRLAQRALGEITGEVSSDDLLDRIFSSFCIGK